MSTLVDLVRRSLSAEAAETFERRVDEQAAFLADELERGVLEAPDFALGMELEVYAVDESARLRTLPDSVFEGAAAKELGLHNAEVNTAPTAFTPAGIAAQHEALERGVAAARDSAAAVDRDLALDAMWTVPPPEGSATYLSETEEVGDVVLAANMRSDPRYHALDNAALRRAGGEIPFEVPGASLAFPTILFESLATSIQPHLQIPDTARFPAYFNAAVRTLGPVLALSTNSPFLPGDLYDPGDPADLVASTHHELRIAAFEQSMNQGERAKVRVPRDLEATADVLDRVAADEAFAPFLREWLEDADGEGYAGRFWEFDHKRGTYWRWLRCVVGGAPVEGAGDGRSLRIEYRPLPTQPTVADTVGLQCLVAGLVRGLVAADHPLADLPWEAARACFYDVARDGLEADLAWLTADGDRTGDPDVVFAEVFEYARRGLAEAGLSDAAIEDYLAPIRARWEGGTVPSAWKKARVRERLDDGASLAEAIASMQRAYLRRSREGRPFATWD